jgi:primosomal protein N' (replication factor Y)
MRADIAIPRTKVDYFTYETEEELEPGDLVIVPIRNKFKYGIVINKDSKRDVAGIKKVKELVDTKFIPAKMLELYQWMANYYLSPLGDVLKLAVPSKILKKYDYVETRAREAAFADIPRPNQQQLGSWSI